MAMTSSTRMWIGPQRIAGAGKAAVDEGDAAEYDARRLINRSAQHRLERAVLNRCRPPEGRSGCRGLVSRS